MAIGLHFPWVTGFPVLSSEAPLHYTWQNIPAMDTPVIIKLFCCVHTVNHPLRRKR